MGVPGESCFARVYMSFLNRPDIERACMCFVKALWLLWHIEKGKMTYFTSSGLHPQRRFEEGRSHLLIVYPLPDMPLPDMCVDTMF